MSVIFRYFLNLKIKAFYLQFYIFFSAFSYQKSVSQSAARLSSNQIIRFHTLYLPNRIILFIMNCLSLSLFLLLAAALHSLILSLLLSFIYFHVWFTMSVKLLTSQNDYDYDYDYCCCDILARSHCCFDLPSHTHAWLLSSHSLLYASYEFRHTLCSPGLPSRHTNWLKL